MMPLGVKPGYAPKVTSWSMEQRSSSSKFFFSETERGIALIFSMQHLLVNLFQVYSYDAPRVKIGPTPGVTSLNIGSKMAKFKILLLLNLKAWSFHITSPGGTSTKFVHMMPLG